MAPQDTRYHADEKAAPWKLASVSDELLQMWASDPNCIEMEVCAKAWAERLEKRARPFDPRTEVSADARHMARKIVLHFWILFALSFIGLPFMIAVVLAIVGQLK